MASKKTVPVREITKEERREAEAFTEMLSLFYESFTQNKGRIGMDSFRSYQDLKKNAKRFHNYPWFAGIKKFVTNADTQFKEYFTHKREANKLDTTAISNLNLAALAALKSGNVSSFVKYKSSLEKVTLPQQGIQDKPEEHMYNPLYIENPMIFVSRNFLEIFERNHMEDMMNKDLNKYKYTYLPMAQRSANNFQYIAYWIMELRNTNEPVELDNPQFIKYTKITYDTDEFEALTEMVKKYLYSNDKLLLSQIMKEVAKYPDLVEANNRSKEHIDIVYRGMGFSDEDDPVYQERVMDEEKERRYVATSTSEYSAQNFEYGRGHLEGGRRSDYGYMITYELTPESMILDLSIFGSAYGEGEVIIDTAKAELVNIEKSYNTDDGDGY